MLALLLLSSVAAFSGNPVDQKISDSLAWENKEAASTLSDFTLWANILGSATYAATAKDRRKERLITTAAAHGINSSFNFLVKKVSNRERPNKKDNLSFYSGHTSTAFTSAGLICLQTNKRVCSYSIGLAALTGYLRIASTWHWPSDVIVGAGIGFVSGKYLPTIIVNF